MSGSVISDVALEFFRGRLKRFFEMVEADAMLSDIVYSDGKTVVDSGGRRWTMEDSPLTDAMVMDIGANAAVFSVSVREDVESVESPVIPWRGGMQEVADVDAGEPPPL